MRTSLGKLYRHQGAVDASGLGGNCNGIFEIAILGLAAILSKCLTGADPEFCSMLSVLTCFGIRFKLDINNSPFQLEPFLKNGDS